MPALVNDQKKFVSKLSEIGGKSGNKNLRENILDWYEDRYLKVRDSLVEAGIIERGRGRGGSVVLDKRKAKKLIAA